MVARDEGLKKNNVKEHHRDSMRTGKSEIQDAGKSELQDSGEREAVHYMEENFSILSLST